MLRDLDTTRPSAATPALAQDGEEYADEIRTLLTLILGRLRGDRRH